MIHLSSDRVKAITTHADTEFKPVPATFIHEDEITARLHELVSGDSVLVEKDSKLFQTFMLHIHSVNYDGIIATERGWISSLVIFETFDIANDLYKLAAAGYKLSVRTNGHTEPF